MPRIVLPDGAGSADHHHNPSTGQAHPGVAIVPDYCGEDDDC
jgi:hypothetical protein